MPTPASERRLHSGCQIRLGRVANDVPLSPSRYATMSESATKPRRVLADLPGNDSPIAGIASLSCSETPTSNLKSTVACRSFSRRFACSPSADDNMSPSSATTISTPVGESLLRSQVQLLLQKVENDANKAKQPPTLRTLCLLQNCMESPALKLVAPTPMNTPCCNAVPANTPPVLTTVSSDNRDTHSISQHEQSVTYSASDTFNLTETSQISETIAVNINEVSRDSIVDVGKKTTRVLQFESPVKRPVMASGCELSYSESFSPSSRDALIEDDQASVWSVQVNISSPFPKRDVSEISSAEEVSIGSSNVVCGDMSSQDDSCIAGGRKVDLLWNSKSNYRSHCDMYDEEVEEDEVSSDCGIYCGTGSDFEEESIQCEDLCKSFLDMNVEDSTKPLPQGEGKHTRFVYGSDDGEEVETVEFREKYSDGVQLTGLPAHKGKHLIFCEDNEEEDNADSDQQTQIQ